MKKFLRYWLPVLIWIAIIFYFSSRGSDNIIVASAKPSFVYHFLEFLILSFLFFRAFRAYKTKNAFLLSILFSTLYGLTDEIHQLFVPGRAFELKDILIDFLGSCLILIKKVFKLQR